MKKLLFFATTLLFSLSVAAQNSDAETFAAAPRKALNLPKGASGYTIERVTLFDSPQTISVICYSPKRFTTSIVLPEI